jgi:hypothetical protein
MNISLSKNRTTSIVGLTLTLLGTLVTPSQATTLVGFSTTGEMMGGMQITASFLDGTSESAVWTATGKGSGGAYGNNWSLSETGNSFNSPWTLTNNGIGITSLVIDAIPGNTVFDNVKVQEVTPGSADGWPFQTLIGQSPNISSYSNPIDISQGDLFGSLSLYWTNGFSGSMKFRADTDSGSSNDRVKPKYPTLINVPPTVDLSVPIIYEGQSASTLLSAIDPNPGAIAFFLNNNYLGTDFQQSGTRAINANLGYFADNGDYVYTAKVRDENGNYSAPVSKILHVLNVPPTVTGLDIPTIYEGQRAKAYISATDVGADAISFYLNDRYVGTDTNTSGTRSVTARLGRFADNGYIPYTAYAQDKDGDWSQPVAGGLTVLNRRPRLTNFQLSSNVIYQGQSVSALLNSRDAGADYINFFINGKSIGTDLRTTGIRTSQADLGAFYLVGDYTFKGISQDKDKAFSNRRIANLTVLNVAPTITSITPNLTVQAGNLFNFTATATDVGIYDILTYDWDLNMDGNYDDFTGITGNWSFTTPGLHTIGLRVSDGNGGYDFSSFTVNILSQNPIPNPLPGDRCY